MKTALAACVSYIKGKCTVKTVHLVLAWTVFTVILVFSFGEMLRFVWLAGTQQHELSAKPEFVRLLLGFFGLIVAFLMSLMIDNIEKAHNEQQEN